MRIDEQRNNMEPRNTFIGRLRLVLLTGVASLIGIGLSAAEIPNAPLTEWIRQSPLPTARNLTGASWATSTHALASGEAYFGRDF